MYATMQSILGELKEWTAGERVKLGRHVRRLSCGDKGVIDATSDCHRGGAPSLPLEPCVRFSAVDLGTDIKEDK